MKEHLPLISNLDLRRGAIQPQLKLESDQEPPVTKEVTVFERISDHVKKFVKGGEK